MRWLLDRLSGALGLHASAGSLLELGVVLLLVVGAAALAARLIPRRLPGRRPAARQRARVPAYEAARVAALRLAETDPREALRLLYAAALAELGRRRGWRARPGRTNWGFVRELGPGAPEATALAECTRLFERTVYGDAPLAAADVHRADELARAVLG